MTFQQLYTELTDMRFNTQTVKLAEVKRWVNAAELAVWNSGDWVFKRMPATTLAVTIGGRTPTMPADFNRAIRLYTDTGARVDYREPDLFEELYPAGIANGTVLSYTVINRAIYLGPPPATSVNFKLSYERRYTRSVAGTPTLGVMSADTDTPLWDAEHHYVLVPWAMILGQKLENDPTGDALRAERDMLLASMQGTLIAGVKGEVFPQPHAQPVLQPQPDPGASKL
jgi:hypothetical protein